MKEPEEGPGPGRRYALDAAAWTRPLCALVVAGVAAYASYEHQRDFARQGGADAVSAALWPLSVDGLLLLATIGLLKPAGPSSRRAMGRVVGLSAGNCCVTGRQRGGSADFGMEAGAGRRVAACGAAFLGRASGTPPGPSVDARGTSRGRSARSGKANGAAGRRLPAGEGPDARCPASGTPSPPCVRRNVEEGAADWCGSIEVAHRVGQGDPHWWSGQSGTV
ncbi:DUF2637 domain-containing protein [Streptomyces sp. Y7]|uniref:DUF2637 domain-containing protein n=1 Tax=Streptomyces sp. Y7 TaxID=3342392 RepID=UPI00371BBB19